MNTICINNKPVEPKTWNKERVITFDDIDRVHERPKGTAKRNFNSNKKHFIENEDFYLATLDNAKKYEFRTFKIPTRGLTFLTESGYLMLVKSFTDDLAWTVQRQLVKNYFRMKTQICNPKAQAPIEPKNYCGKRVLTIKDLAQLTGYSRYHIGNIIRELHLGELLEGNPLHQFNRQFGIPRGYQLYVLDRNDVITLLHHLDLYKTHQKFLTTYFANDLTETPKEQYHLITVSEQLMRLANSRMSPEIRSRIYLLASELLVDAGLLDHPTNDLCINTPEGWNVSGKIHQFYRQLDELLTHTL